MKHITEIKWSLAMLTLGLSLTPRAWAQHFHFNAGAPSQMQDTPLYFQNAGDFTTSSGFAAPLTLASNGTYSGFYESGSLTFAAIGSLFPDPATPGTQVRLRFVSVAGPTGGSFGVWNVDGFNLDEVDATTLAFSLPVGTTNGTNSILLSENNGEPGADPFGHIHGRHFSASRPGLYTVSVQLYDASTNGASGGPIHASSDIYPIFFQAGVTIASLAHEPNQTAVAFATRSGSTYYVEAGTDLATTKAWVALAGPLTGNNHLQTATDTDSNASPRFYRLRVTTP
jgi:hypothetical protein